MWMSYCQKHHHTSCSTPKLHKRGRLFNTKIIDCTTREISNFSGDAEYVALSYVWGASATTVPCIHTDDGRVYLPPDMPRTIEDAIAVVLGLRLQYLWVDQYCIDQGDSVEMNRQLRLMDLIYNFAALTIVASAGDSATFGLPGVSCPRDSQPMISLEGRLWVSALEDPRECVARSKWNTRAWTFQEGLFGRQRLLFTKTQVLFECNGPDCFFESLILDPHRFASKGTTSTLLRGDRTGWDSFLYNVSEYTKRETSFQSDALNGLQGIFAHLFSTQEVIQWWGIPSHKEGIQKFFVPSLLWHIDSAVPPRRREGFPSWSWCGWIAPVSWEAPTWMKSGRSTEKRRLFSGSGSNSVVDTVCAIQFQTPEGNPVSVEQATAELKDSHGSTPLRYSQNVLIEAEIIRVCFSELSAPVHESEFGFVSAQHPVILAAVSQMTFGGQKVRITWPLRSMFSITEDPRLHPIHRAEPLKVVVIDKLYGLVVCAVGDVQERIGLIKLEGEIEPEDDRALQLHVVECEERWCGGSKEAGPVTRPSAHLRDHFPCARETVVVG
ncbi:heterokaryon incompatibility protein-domain-containing protein [Boeremia exigua]|uniref:heterokaryon incompatibility protein-domain-containing protein n=1 Tax=Boeremia exigua TaxID=749465 RepID=UPI001E8CA6BC|nr:heterokaryon incompatibility protein-domain-containing protein [Boeremia exigua]KAH6637473.1 heterokaryon incompatibility protein-domain-containing protein [Boeremia exigua]